MPSGTSDINVFALFNISSMEEYEKLSKSFGRFGLSVQTVVDAVKSACDFFNIPMPRLIQDCSDDKNGQTMFINYNSGSYEDDVLCINLNQLVDLRIETVEDFYLVITHECAHRVLQNTRFPGVNNGIWEQELAADYLMGCRAGLHNMNNSKILVSLFLTPGSYSHPDGMIRALFVRDAKFRVIEMRDNSIPLTIPNLLNEFMACSQKYLQEIQECQQKYYRF